MPDAKLVDFVETSLRAGATKDEIQASLEKSGWSSDQIKESLACFADLEFVVPVPKPRVQLSARDAFRYLIIFGMLYVSGFYLGDLLFQFVNLAYPDHTEHNRIESVYSSIRWGDLGPHCFVPNISVPELPGCQGDGVRSIIASLGSTSLVDLSDPGGGGSDYRWRSDLFGLQFPIWRVVAPLCSEDIDCVVYRGRDLWLLPLVE